jgi:hypothetical protein
MRGVHPLRIKRRGCTVAVINDDTYATRNTKSKFYTYRKGGVALIPMDLCNRCGKELDEFDKQCKFCIHTTALYGSVHDGDEIRMNLCCDCFDKAAEECVISPVVEEVH